MHNCGLKKDSFAIAIAENYFSKPLYLKSAQRRISTQDNCTVNVASNILDLILEVFYVLTV